MARDDQVPPDCRARPRDWRTWLLLGGRGAGKTRAGAEWVRAQVRGQPPLAASAAGRIALVGPSYHEARAVMVDGVSGLLRVCATERPRFETSRRRLVWPNGAEAQLFSGEDPEALRGPQFDAAWCDELAKWRHPQETFDMLQFGLRLGDTPRLVVTTTPRPLPLLKQLIAEDATVVDRAPTAANGANLSRAFLAQVEARYAGTRLGRQELLGELIEDDPDALFQRDWIERGRVREAPVLQRIVVAVDPPAGGRGGDGRMGGARAAGGAVLRRRLDVPATARGLGRVRPQRRPARRLRRRGLAGRCGPRVVARRERGAE
ncbi:MAG: terminase family protein [Hyphomicrobiales bacterium]